MIKQVSVFIFVLLFSQIICAQEVVAIQEVFPGDEPNEFNIKTTIKGLVGVDLARVTYFISKKHTYKASSDNRFFSKIEDDFVKFYIMSVPTNGEVVVELGVILGEEGTFSFPVEFQYSKKEEKIVVQLSPIQIENGAVLALNEPSLNDKIEAKARENEEEEASQKKKETQEVEEKIAKENAALAAKIAKVKAIAEKEERERIAKEKADEESVVVTKEKQDEERLAKLEAEEKLARENSELAAKIEKVKAIAQKEEEERLAKEKLAEETRLLAEKEEIAKKLKEKQGAEVLATKKAEEEKLITKKEQPSSGIKYGVQIFALSKYTEQKVRDFCKRNNLEYSKINTLETKGITKIRYGSVNSKAEAEALKKELLTRPQINGGFVVKVSN